MEEYHTTSPPTSDIFSDEMDSISVSLKKAVNKHNNKGYFPVHDQKLNNNALKGRKTFAFWTLVGLLFILAIGNLILTLTILGVLKLGQGMQSVELVPRENAIKLFGEIDLNNLYKRDGRIEGFLDSPIELSAENNAILLNLATRTGRSATKLKIDKNGTTLKGLSWFDVKYLEETIFSATDPLFRNLKQVKSFTSKQVETNQIRSSITDNLKLEGDTIHLKGSEGTSISGRNLLWSADQDIYLKSNNGSIVLNGESGTYLDVNRLTLAQTKLNGYVATQFKICVCMPEGKLFRIPVVNSNDRVYCHHFNPSPQFNPCI